MKNIDDDRTLELLGDAEPRSECEPVQQADIELLQQQAKTYARTHLTGYLIKQDYKPTGFHTYTDQHGQPIYWKVRLKHDSKGKTLRAFSINDGRPVGKDKRPAIGQFMPV